MLKLKNKTNGDLMDVATPRSARTKAAAVKPAAKRDAKRVAVVAVRGSDDTLKSLGKIVRILECFSTTDRTLSVAEVCERTEYPRSTTHRLLASLKEVGLLDQDRHRDRYRLGIKLFELGNIVLANMDLHREARPYVEQLGKVTGQLVHLAVFDGRQAIVIHRSDPSDSATPLTFVESAPVHCTGVGKAILAFQPAAMVDKLIAAGLRGYTDATITSGPALRAELARISKRGYSVDEGEHQPGLRCIGAPIRDQHGRVFAAVSISGSAWKIPADQTEALSKIVTHTAKSISDKL
jgi:DNA-binding IclR family transcriptional regulator